MTATVRIEKTDATDFVICVREEYLNEKGEWYVPEHEIGMVFNDKMLNFPSMSREFGIHSTKRLVITESGSNGMIYTDRKSFLDWADRAIKAEAELKKLKESACQIPS